MKPNWIKTCYLSHREYQLIVYRDNFLDIQKEVKVPKSKDNLERIETYFYIDGTLQEFKTEDSLIKFLPIVKREYTV